MLMNQIIKSDNCVEYSRHKTVCVCVCGGGGGGGGVASVPGSHPAFRLQATKSWMRAWDRGVLSKFTSQTMPHVIEYRLSSASLSGISMQ